MHFFSKPGKLTESFSYERKAPAIELSLILLLAVVYCTHLDYFPLHLYTDEARRALVAAEMMMSGDYVTPTINGEIYLNKPPLYNWIVAGYFRIAGDYSMFAFRLPVIVATFGMGATVFYFFRKYTYHWLAFFTAIAYMTNGRILLYDSLQGLIDTSFSWLVFLNFMLIFHFGEKKKYWALFLMTYFITALGFLMKGLPAVVFQGLTLLTYFALAKDLKRIISFAHVTGVILFILITGSYYLTYFNVNDLPPSTLFKTIFTESSKRTAVKFGLKDTLIHLLTFPFEMLYHFAPWTLFALILFQKKIFSRIREHKFLHYMFWIGLVNIIIYWSSVEVFARYLLMFVPIIYGILLYLFDTSSDEHLLKKAINLIITVVMGLAFLGSISLFFIPALKEENGFYFKVLLLVLLFGLAFLSTIKFPQARLYAFVFSLIVLRMGFNWFVVERRTPEFFTAVKLAEKIHGITYPSELYLLKNVQAGNFDPMSFHISTRKGTILRYKEEIDTSVFYIADIHQLKDRNYKEFLKFENYLSDTLKLVKFIK